MSYLRLPPEADALAAWLCLQFASSQHLPALWIAAAIDYAVVWES